MLCRSKTMRLEKLGTRNFSKMRPTVKLQAHKKMFNEKRTHRFDPEMLTDKESAAEIMLAYKREYVIPYVNNRYFMSEALMMCDRQIRNRVHSLMKSSYETKKQENSKKPSRNSAWEGNNNNREERQERN